MLEAAWISEIRGASYCTHVSPKNFRTYPGTGRQKAQGQRPQSPAPWRQPGEPEASCEDSSLVSFRASLEGGLWVGLPPPAAEAARAPLPHRSSQLRASAGSPGCLCSRRGSKPEVQPRLPQALLRILHLRAGIIYFLYECSFPWLKIANLAGSESPVRHISEHVHEGLRDQFA